MFEKTEPSTKKVTRFTVEIDTGKAFIYSPQDGRIDIEMDYKNPKVVSLVDYIGDTLEEKGYITEDVATDKAEFVALVDAKLVAEEPVVLEK